MLGCTNGPSSWSSSFEVNKTRAILQDIQLLKSKIEMPKYLLLEYIYTYVRIWSYAYVSHKLIQIEERNPLYVRHDINSVMYRGKIIPSNFIPYQNTGGRMRLLLGTVMNVW